RRPSIAASGAAAGAATLAHPRPSRTRALGATSTDRTPDATAAVPAATGGEDPPSRSRRRGRGLLAALLVLLLLGGGIGYWYGTAGPGATVVVPDVAGQTRDEASAALSG